MKPIIEQLINNYKEHNKSLSRTKLLLNHPWTLVDDNDNTIKYIFKKGGHILASENGEVKEGTWEYLSEAKSLYLKFEDSKILYNEIHFQDAILVLSKDGNTENVDVFVNSNVIPDLNWVKHLESERNETAPKLESSKNKDVELELEIKSSNGYGKQLADKIHLHEGRVVKIDNGRLVEYDERSISLVDGSTITLFSPSPLATLGVFAVKGGVLCENGKYICKDPGLSIFQTKDGLVIFMYSVYLRFDGPNGMFKIHKPYYNYSGTETSKLVTLNDSFPASGNYQMDKTFNAVVEDGLCKKIYFRSRFLRLLTFQSVTEEELILTEPEIL
jgi:hypothetical protein